MILRFLGFLLWNEFVCSNCVCVNMNRAIHRIKPTDGGVPPSRYLCSKRSYVATQRIQVT